jgi:hypothetical protein
MQLKDFLPLPVQRIGRYPLLLRDLLKKTDPGHKDYQNLVLASELVKTLADQINEKKRQEEERTGLFEVYRETKDCPARLVSAKRRWINSFTGFDVKSRQKVNLSVFSDLLMIAFSNKSAIFKTEFKYRFSRWIDLFELNLTGLVNDMVKIDVMPENASFSRASNTFPSDVKSLTFQFPSTKVYNDFIRCVTLERDKCLKDEEELFRTKLEMNV